MKKDPFSRIYLKHQFPWRLALIIISVALLMSLLRCSPYATPKDVTFPKPFQFTLIDTVACPKDKLYKRAMGWVVKTYNSANEVIQLHDKDDGKIVLKAIMKIPVTTVDFETVNYTMTIEVKDNKYRCTIGDLYHSGGTYDVYSGNNSYGSLDTDAVYVTTVDLEKELKTPAKFRYIKSKCVELSNFYLADLRSAMASSEKDF